MQEWRKKYNETNIGKGLILFYSHISLLPGQLSIEGSPSIKEVMFVKGGEQATKSRGQESSRAKGTDHIDIPSLPMRKRSSCIIFNKFLNSAV